MKIYIVETLDEIEGGYAPDSRVIVGVFSSYELAEECGKKNKDEYNEIDINSYEVDEEEELSK